MHHEHDPDYEAQQGRSEADWEYADPRSSRREAYPTRRYSDQGPYGRERPYGPERRWREPYDQSDDRAWERSYGTESEAPNEAARRPYGEGSYVQYDRLAPARRRSFGRAGEAYGSGSAQQEGWSRSGSQFGPYSGRGPKGYTRSPERILEDVAERLTDDPDVDASEIEVSVERDVVVLRGRVYDRGQKRAAEDVVETVSGVRDVRNELDVERGMLQELTDAVTGRSEEREPETTRQPSPPNARVP